MCNLDVQPKRFGWCAFVVLVGGAGLVVGVVFVAWLVFQFVVGFVDVGFVAGFASKSGSPQTLSLFAFPEANADPLAKVNGRPQLKEDMEEDCQKWAILNTHSDAFETLNMDVRVSVLGRIGQRNVAPTLWIKDLSAFGELRHSNQTDVNVKILKVMIM